MCNLSSGAKIVLQGQIFLLGESEITQNKIFSIPDTLTHQDFIFCNQERKKLLGHCK